MYFILGLILALFLNAGCLATNKKDPKADHRLNELQLQEEIQRFYTRFTARIVETQFKDRSIIQNNNVELLREYLLYDSEALKIATSPYPVVNLLDMIVFIKLNKIVIKDYWIPKVYGDSGKVLYEAFRKSEVDIENVANKILTQSQMTELNSYIRDWRNENQHLVKVEKIRFGDFARYAKDYGPQEKARFSLVDTQSAVKAVDQMVLVANRGIFLAQHMPLIVRLHTRLGAQEIISDTAVNFNGNAQMMEDIQEAQPLVENLTELTREANQLTKDVRGLISDSDQKFSLQSMESLVNKTTILLRELRTSRPQTSQDISLLREEFHNAIWFIAFVIIFVGIILSLVFWSGYYVSKRFLR